MSTDVAIRWLRLPLSNEQRSRSLAELSDAERTREPTDAFLGGRLLLRELAPGLPITAACPDCGREHGQPRLEGRFASIAHTDGFVVAIVVDTPVGIDIEPENADVPAIFAPDVAGWTAIEAVLKADGRGLRVDPAEVRFASPRRAAVGGRSYEISYVETVPGFTTAVARAVPSAPATRRTARRAASR